MRYQSSKGLGFDLELFSLESMMPEKASMAMQKRYGERGFPSIPFEPLK